MDEIDEVIKSSSWIAENKKFRVFGVIGGHANIVAEYEDFDTAYRKALSLAREDGINDSYIVLHEGKVVAEAFANGEGKR